MKMPAVNCGKIFDLSLFSFPLHLGSITIRRNCSTYIFHMSEKPYKWYTWSKSFQLCEEADSHLVSIESFEEWSFLNRTIQTMETEEYLIGLKLSFGEWRWSSDNSTVHATKQGTWPWATFEPSKSDFRDEHCVIMFKNYSSNYGRYNNVPCGTSSKRFGYICEAYSVDCNGKEGKFEEKRNYSHYRFFAIFLILSLGSKQEREWARVEGTIIFFNSHPPPSSVRATRENSGRLSRKKNEQVQIQ